MGQSTTMTALLDAVNSTKSFLNTTMLDEPQEGEEGDEEEEGGWPYFRIFGKTYMSFIIIILILGLIGNVLSWILMSDTKISSFAYCIYMRWLAVSDSLVLITVCTEDITDTYGHLYTFLTYDLAICKLWGFLQMTVRSLSPWLVVGLTFDRFVCLFFPRSRNRFCTKTKAVIICSCLTLVSAVGSVGILTNNVIMDGECETQENLHLFRYIIFQDLVGVSLLPSLTVFVLNVILVVRIRRNTPLLETTDGRSTKDKSFLPLILVSFFAFVTLIPIGVTQVVEYLLEKTGSDHRALRLANEIWPLFNLIYLLNFGQNFYIVMASSGYYRRIMARKLHIGNKPVSEEMSYSKTDCTRVNNDQHGTTELADFKTYP